MTFSDSVSLYLAIVQTIFDFICAFAAWKALSLAVYQHEIKEQEAKSESPHNRKSFLLQFWLWASVLMTSLVVILFVAYMQFFSSAAASGKSISIARTKQALPPTPQPAGSIKNVPPSKATLPIAPLVATTFSKKTTSSVNPLPIVPAQAKLLSPVVIPAHPAIVHTEFTKEMPFVVVSEYSENDSVMVAESIHDKLKAQGFNVIENKFDAALFLKVEDVVSRGCPFDPESQDAQGRFLNCGITIHIVAQSAQGATLFDKYFTGTAPETAASVGNGDSDSIANALPNIYNYVLDQANN